MAYSLASLIISTVGIKQRTNVLRNCHSTHVSFEMSTILVCDNQDRSGSHLVSFSKLQVLLGDRLAAYVFEFNVFNLIDAVVFDALQITINKSAGTAGFFREKEKLIYQFQNTPGMSWPVTA